MPYFRTPSVREKPYSRHGLIGRTYLDRGLTILRTGTTVIATTDPEADAINSATVVFLGGHLYFIDDTEAALLTAAGYGNWVSDVVPGSPDDSLPGIDYSQYGQGLYGTGPYGD